MRMRNTDIIGNQLDFFLLKLQISNNLSSLLEIKVIYIRIRNFKRNQQIRFARN